MNITITKVDNRYAAKKLGFNYGFSVNNMRDSHLIRVILEEKFNQDDEYFFRSFITPTMDSTKGDWQSYGIIHYSKSYSNVLLYRTSYYMFRDKGDFTMALMLLS